MNTLTQRERLEWRDIPMWFRVLVVIAMINFLSYVAIASANGGDAINGYRHAGQYFVCAHGACTEVSRAFWWYSYWHTIAVWITHGSALIGGFYFVGRRLTSRLTKRWS